MLASLSKLKSLFCPLNLLFVCLFVCFFFCVVVAIASMDRKVPFSPRTQASFRSSLLSTLKVTYRVEEATNGNTSAFAGYSDICQCLRLSMIKLADVALQSCVYHCGTNVLSADIFFKQLDKLLQEARNR